MASKYSYNTRDIKFILKEWLPSAEIFAYDAYKDFYDVDDIDMIIDQYDKVAETVMAAAADDDDETPVHMEDGVVVTPGRYRSTVKYIQENGWGTSNVAGKDGALPFLVTCAANEFMNAASPSIMPFIGISSGAARLILNFGDDGNREMFLPKMYDGDWSGTMCLTEPSAGSDVGDILSKATPTDDPRVYSIKGQKLFITGGDGGHVDNVIHLYLARIEGAAPGTKGISLFIVPKLWVNEDGSLESNDVIPVSVEHKLGLRGSPTATLNFGDNGGCRGWLLGSYDAETGVGEGMAQMFQMMNEERLLTGSSSLGVAANAYFNTVAYCSERVQGRPITDPRGERVRLIEHEDVKRMLMVNKATLEACRAIVDRTAYYIEVETNDPDPERRRYAAGMADCLVPIAKAYTTDESWTLISESIQAHGGYGYSEEYPVAKAARDVRIYAIWEGTNYIQALDLLGRKWTMGKGAVFASFLKQIDDFIEENRAREAIAGEVAILERAQQAYKSIMKSVGGYMKDGRVGLMPTYATRILAATAQLYGGMCLLEQALIAQKRLDELGDGHFDAAFYRGKLMSARYYLRNVVPNVWATEELVAEADPTIMDASEDIFAY
jgi:alkylation response protein AidB-like acyl-CoA dehydrogenase